MLKRIVMQLSGRLTALCTQVLVWLTIRLWNPASSLLVSSIRVFLSAINRLNPLAQMVLNFKAWAVNLTTAVQSIKRVLSTAKAKVIQIGLQLQTIACQILLPVTTAFKKSKELVVLIKLAVSRISASKTVLILTVRQWIQAGLKLLETVRQRLLHVLHLQSLNKKLVELTKLVQYLLKKVVAALTRMVFLLKVIGLKQVGTAPQPQQRAQRQRSKGH
jgi:hypothetical protein